MNVSYNMFVKEESQYKFYLVECSDWKILRLASSSQDAAIEALRIKIEELGTNLNISFILSVKDVQEKENQTFFSVPALLSDLGFFKLSSDLAILSDFVLDKGQNPLNISSVAKKY